MKFNRCLLKCICTSLMLALSLQAAPIYAAGKSYTLYKETFDSVPVNGVPKDFDINGEKARTLNSLGSNKVLQVIKGGKTTVTVPMSTQAQKYFIDFKG